MQPWRWRTTRSRPRPADALQTRSRIGTESSTQNFPRIIEVRIFDFPSGVRFVFDKARAKIDKKLPDPAGYSDDVAAYVNTRAAMDNIVNRLAWAYETGVEAERLAKNGYVEQAFDKWASIFKGYFPSYR
jgi:hypothetical protein